jgi:hypothetical protein
VPPTGTQNSRHSPITWSMRSAVAWRRAARTIATNGAYSAAASRAGSNGATPHFCPPGLPWSDGQPTSKPNATRSWNIHPSAPPASKPTARSTTTSVPCRQAVASCRSATHWHHAQNRIRSLLAAANAATSGVSGRR